MDEMFLHILKIPQMLSVETLIFVPSASLNGPASFMAFSCL